MTDILTKLAENRQKKVKRQQKLNELSHSLMIQFSEIFPNVSKSQGRVIIKDAIKNGKVVHDKNLPITDRVFLMTLSFLRHQFYYKLHYGFNDKRQEANRQALEIMKEWGYNPDKHKEKVTCPGCLGDKCSFCYTGEVSRWAALNYERRVNFQQGDGDKSWIYRTIE